MTLVWDWNGTLLDDTQASVDALNVQLVQRGLSPITLAFYREHFSFPVRPFYALCGMDLEHEDWDALAQGYHDAYHAQPTALNEEAVAALTLARESGVRQIIVSALRQDYLDAATERFGIRGFFDAVVGSDNLDGASKLDHARAFFARAASDHPELKPPFVCIGDSFHDKEMADALGARCILFGGGSHAPARLAAVDTTVITLVAAVRLAMRRFAST